MEAGKQVIAGEEAKGTEPGQHGSMLHKTEMFIAGSDLQLADASRRLPGVLTIGRKVSMFGRCFLLP
jgi:hypothetical protein